MEIEPDGLNARSRHRLTASAVVPRPIAWVTTVSPGGVGNAAPFSFASGFGYPDPVEGVFSVPPPRSVKHGPEESAS